MVLVPVIFGLVNLNQINFKIIVVRLVKNAQIFFKIAPMVGAVACHLWGIFVTFRTVFSDLDCFEST